MKTSIPIEMVTLTPIRNGVFEWTIHYNITPIPFISTLVATIKSALVNDEDKLNQIMQEQGVGGTATFISKKVELNWLIPYVSVSGFTIKYEVAFTTPLGPLTKSASVGVTKAFIVWVSGIIITLLGYLTILNVTSYLKSISPKEFTPRKPGDCPKNYSYDAKENKCVYTPPKPPDWLMWAVLAPVALGGTYLAIKLYQDSKRRK